MNLLGLDIGSSRCKAVVFDHQGNIVARSIIKEYFPATAQNGITEMDGEIFWDSTVEVVRDISRKIGKDGIGALAVSSHGETFIALDKFGRACGPAIMNSDNRAVKEVIFLLKSMGKEKIYSIAGAPLHPMFPLAKIIWLKRNKPDIYENTRYFLSVADFILYRMGMGAFTDFSLASRTLLFDVNKQEWSEEILNEVDIDKSKFSTPRPSGKMIGKLNNDAAKLLGLRKGTVVGLGGHDQCCCALGSGVVRSKEVVSSAGTYESLIAVSDKPSLGGDSLLFSLNSYCHVVPNKYITLAFCPAGIMVRWFVDTFCEQEKENAKKERVSLYEYLERYIPPYATNVCTTPHIIGSCNPYWNPRATAAIVGINPATSKFHIYKSILEGICCELNINIKILEKVIGPFNSMIITGGGSKSRSWVQLRSDITRKKFQTLKNAEATCLGAAVLAGMAAGFYKKAEDAVKNLVEIDKTYYPDLKKSKNYEMQKKRYELLYPSLEKYRKIAM